jgi:hypothetical protein
MLQLPSYGAAEFKCHFLYRQTSFAFLISKWRVSGMFRNNDNVVKTLSVSVSDETPDDRRPATVPEVTLLCRMTVHGNE